MGFLDRFLIYLYSKALDVKKISSELKLHQILTNLKKWLIKLYSYIIEFKTKVDISSVMTVGFLKIQLMIN